MVGLTEQFAIGYFLKKGKNSIPEYHYGDREKVEKIFEPLWKKGDTYHTVTILYFRDKEGMLEEIKQRKEWLADYNVFFNNVEKSEEGNIAVKIG